MLKRPERWPLARSRNVLTVAALTAALMIATLAAVSVRARSDSASPSPITVVADDGLPGKGLPPSPGPTNPNGAD